MPMWVSKPIRTEWVTDHYLTHWGRVTHICISRITNIGSDNGLSPGRRQAIIWTNAEILLIEPFGTNFSEIFMAIHTFSFKKMHLNMSFGKWRTFCLGLNVLTFAEPRKTSQYYCCGCHGSLCCQAIISNALDYRKISNIRRTKPQNLNDSPLVLQLSLPNPLKPDIKWRMKM